MDLDATVFIVIVIVAIFGFHMVRQWWTERRMWQQRNRRKDED